MGKVRCVVVLVVGLLLSEAVAIDYEGRRPPPLKPKPGCMLWRGEAVGGNDPTVELQLRLCSGEGVDGEVQWSSLKSGWSVRSVEGSWSEEGKKLRLRDLEMLESKPNEGWYFCMIDAYRLERVEGKEGDLEGEYVSEECMDRARLRLKYEGRVVAPSETQREPIREEEEEEETRKVDVGPCGGCAQLSRGVGQGDGLWVLLALVVVCMRRRG